MRIWVQQRAVGQTLGVANMYMFKAFYFPGFLSLQRYMVPQWHEILDWVVGQRKKK